jgi:ankyrin repeat protein
MTLPDVWRALHERDAEALDAAIAASGTEVRDRGGGTPLMEAVTQGEAAFVEMLLDRGADPNAQSREGVTALHLACIHHRVEIARTLLRAGARHDLPDCGGNAPLARAVFESRGRGE